MSRPRISVFFSSTWGEMGNQLAAGALARQIERLGRFDVDVVAIETILPLFGEIGGRIAKLSIESQSPAERARRYAELMKELSVTFPDGFEHSGNGPSVSPLFARLAERAVDISIGTKGVITRVLIAAARHMAQPPAVVNHLTNHGLLTLPIHRVPDADLHLTQFPEGEDDLIRHGVPRSMIVCLGAFSAADDLAAALSEKANERTARLSATSAVRLVILSNRGGEPFLRFVSLLAGLPEAKALDLVFIDGADPSAVAAVARLAEHRGLPWRSYTKLPQSDYLAELAHLRSARTPILVCKPGPNTVVEAVRIGVPCLILDSGLPMETWVTRFIAENRIGISTDEPESLVAEASRIASEGWGEGWSERLARVRSRLFDPVRTARRLEDALTRVLEHRTTAHAAQNAYEDG